MTPPPTDALDLLAQALARYFNEDELKGLCFGLGVEWDELPTNGHTTNAQALVSFLERRGRLLPLLDTCAELRPHAAGKWTIIRQRLELQPTETASPETIPLQRHITGRIMFYQVGQLENRLDRLEKQVAAIAQCATTIKTVVAAHMVATGILFVLVLIVLVVALSHT